MVGRADPQCYDFMMIAIIMYSALTEKSNTAKWTKTNVYSRLTASVLLMLASISTVLVAGLCKETGFTTFGMFVLLEGYFLLKTDSIQDKVKNFVVAVRTGIVLVVGGLMVLWRLRYTQGEWLFIDKVFVFAFDWLF